MTMMIAYPLQKGNVILLQAQSLLLLVLASKKDLKTKRWIRQVDVAPTMAVLLGTRFPHECEGAPVYQIFSEEV